MDERILGDEKNVLFVPNVSGIVDDISDKLFATRQLLYSSFSRIYKKSVLAIDPKSG